MEREQVNEVRRPASRMNPRPQSPLVPIEDRVALAEVRGGAIEPNGDEIKPDYKKSSGAFAITVPPEDSSEEAARQEPPSEN